MGARGFFSSFENTDPPLTWIDVVDIDDNGRPRAAGATMSTREGGGPAKPYTGKAGVGFTGTRALRYQGTHPGREAASVVNKLYLVDMLVARDTELSYVVFPELLGEDLRYPSTYVSLDLAFDDGTRLSELGLTDQLGFAWSARGQGESRALAPGQWNRRAVRLGARRRGQGHRQGAARLRQPGRARGVRRLDRRHRDRRPAPARGPPPGRPRGHDPRHELHQGVLAGQHVPRRRRAARVQLLDPGDRRRREGLDLHLPAAQHRPEPAGDAGARGQPPAEPVAGRPADVPGAALRRGTQAARPAGGRGP